MEDLNKLNYNLYNLFKNLISKFYTKSKNTQISNKQNICFYSDSDVNNIFVLLFNIFLLLDSLLQFFYRELEKYNYNNERNNKNIQFMLKSFSSNHYNLLKLYYGQYNIKEKYTYLKLLENVSNYKSNIYINTNINFIKDNIEICDINDLLHSSTLELNNISIINTEVNKNKIQYEYVDIGFNNMYKLHIYDNLEDNIPFNLLVYIKKIDQVVIKVGNDNNFKFINSKLYRTYDIKNKINNDRSILCNNNIKSLNKKCQNGIECKYYHDIILGYEDNYHSNRQFSFNPIIYNCVSFKDGASVKENTKKINWHDAINLYQSNLSCILIACIHATTN